VVSLPGDLLFDSGSASPSAGAALAATAIGPVLSRLDNRIEVAGYTDPRPKKGDPGFNWRLSLARASAIADLLHGVGYRRHILVRGFGPTTGDVPGDGPGLKNSLALARRTDIVILQDAGQGG
jgi:chemotaxis protein MotB